MGYYIDLKKISLDDYQKNLENALLIPSRLILKQDLEKRFYTFKQLGFRNIYELQQAFKKKEKLQEFAKKNQLPENYLTILIREINSIQPKPNKLKEFPGISEEIVLLLEKIGIKDTFMLFDKVLTAKSRKELTNKSGISDINLLELTKLTDLSRIKWVGAMFARVLYESGFDTVEKVSKANFEELYNTIKQINDKNNFYKGRIGLNDMKLCVLAAKEVPLEIEYEE